MKKLIVSDYEDLYSLKEISGYYDEITIKLNKLKFQGLIRHAVKYANNALVTGGIMIIESSPFESYVLTRNKIDFWQVKYEVFGSLKDTIEILEVSNAEGRLRLQKKKHLYNYDGISFGIVFSGNKQEEQQLFKSIDTILKNDALKSLILRF